MTSSKPILFESDTPYTSWFDSKHIHWMSNLCWKYLWAWYSVVSIHSSYSFATCW